MNGINLKLFSLMIIEACSKVDENSSTFEKYNVCKRLEKLEDDIKDGEGELKVSTCKDEETGEKMVCFTITDTIRKESKEVRVTSF